MAVRVRDFCRVHPSADGNYALVLGQVEEKINRMQELARQEEGGIATPRASVRHAGSVTATAAHELLRHLVTVAAVAAGELPGLEEHFELWPGTRATRRSGPTPGKLLEQGQAQKDLLASARAGGQAARRPRRRGGGVRRVGGGVERGAPGPCGRPRGPQGSERRRPAVGGDARRTHPLPVQRQRGAAGGVGKREERVLGSRGRRSRRRRRRRS